MRPSGRRVAMVVYGDVSYDSRVQKEATSLARAGHRVTLYCLDGSPEAMRLLDPRVAVRIVPIRGRRGLPHAPSPFLHASRLGRPVARIRWLAAYVLNLLWWSRAVGRAARGSDVWHAHDFTGVVACWLARPGAPVVYDVHDLFLETGTGGRLPRPLRWLAGRLERRLVRRAALVVTVNQGLADRYRDQVPADRLLVVHNCAPAFEVPEPRPTLLRDALGLAVDQPVVLYHGLLDRARGLDTLLEAMLDERLGRAHLVLLGAGHDRDRLAEMAAEPRFEGRVHLLDPIPPSDLLPWVASADVGAMPMPPATLNLYLSTPNKLFECLAAGVPVVVSDFPEVRRIVVDDPEGPLGRTCDPVTPVDVARATHEVLDLDPAGTAELRRRCAVAAAARWNWDSQAAPLVAAYDLLPMWRAAAPRP